MDRGVSMPNMLESKASIFFFLYSITIQERCFEIHIMFIYLSAFSDWKEEHIWQEFKLCHWLKGNPTTTLNNPLSVEKLVERIGSFCTMKDSYQLVSWLSMLLYELLSHSGAFSMLAPPCSSAHSLSGWILYVAYSGESNAQSVIQTTHITIYSVVYV